jgi:hypothetical protein
MRRTTALGLGLLALSSLDACGHGSKACAVIDALHDGCAVVRYLAPDGTYRDVKVNGEDLLVAAHRAEARQRPSPAGTGGSP